jgi:predicted amidophosphoribosyltransferase
LLLYDGAGRELVARLKYRNGRSALGWLADGMAALIPVAERTAIDVVTWAPTTRKRAATRGFDQAELLARRVASRLGVCCQRLLERRASPPQTGRDAAARRIGPVFTVRGVVNDGRVLVVDDVVTTGATVAAAAAALRGAGARTASVVAAARTPLKISADATDA